ncbi:MAG TPA: D-TA family PLP-dependent enzyme [Puia sp.]|nr:D-TA family PLP-dependent enzyme [Puia sp.]
MSEWYEITNVDELDTPALVVYPDRIRQNIARAVAMVGEPGRLRPHVKTHKSPAVTRLMLAAGIRQFKCATIAEAEMLALEGAPDVLLAYQPVGPKITRLTQLIRQFPDTRFSCLIDHPDAAAAMARTFHAAGLTVPVYLDLNVGMDRTGIAPGPQAVQLYQLALDLPGIDPVGLHIYDGHIRDTDPDQLKAKCDAAFAPVLALRDATKKDLRIIAGGSPTFPVHAGRPAEIQCSPGTFVYWDKGYGDQFPAQPFRPDALVVTRVISLRGESRLCLDLGHKSIAAENELTRRVFFLNGPELKAVGQSEEHLVVEAGTGHGYRIGDVLYGVPYHICPTVALYERAVTVEAGRTAGEWKNVARDRKISV